jgi:hypothetical protein
MKKLKRVRSSTSAKRLLASVALFTMVFGAAARTSSATTLTGTPTTTTISGFSGTAFTVGDAESTTHAVFGLSSEERFDKPCFVKVKKEIITDPTTQTFPSKDLCGPNGSTSSEIQADFSNTDETGESVFVTGIRVCMNSAKTRVKGFQLRGKEVSDHGTLIDLRPGGTDPRSCGAVITQGSVEFRLCGDDVTLEPMNLRPNCDQSNGWMSWVECSAGKVATALVLHYEGGNEPRSLTGIALKCKTVAP